MKLYKRKKKRILQNENRLRKHSNFIKCNNIQIIGVQEEERRKKGDRKFIWIITKNFPNLGKETYIGGTENSDQNQQKQIHTKTHCS